MEDETMAEAEADNGAKKTNGNIPDNFLDVGPSRQLAPRAGSGPDGRDTCTAHQMNETHLQDVNGHYNHDAKSTYTLECKSGSNSASTLFSSPSDLQGNVVVNNCSQQSSDARGDNEEVSTDSCDRQNRAEECRDAAQTSSKLVKAGGDKSLTDVKAGWIGDVADQVEGKEREGAVAVSKDQIGKEGHPDTGFIHQNNDTCGRLGQNGCLGKESIDASISEKAQENTELVKVGKEKTGRNIEQIECEVNGENLSTQDIDMNGSCLKACGGEINSDRVDSQIIPTVKRKRGRPRLNKEVVGVEGPIPEKITRSKGNSSLSCCEEPERNEESDDEEAQTCLGCGDTFHSQAQLTEHELTCPFISQLGSNITNLTFNCPLCKVNCTRKHGLKRHLMRKHPKIDSFTCTICHMKIDPMHDFLQHLHAHVRSVKLLRKHKNVLTPQQLSEKIKSSDEAVTGLPESEFICIQCNMSVKNDHSLVLHMLGHKINETLKYVSKDSNKTDDDHKSLGSSPMDINFISSDAQLTSENSSSQPQVSKSQLTASILLDSFSCLSPELISTINRSFEVMTFLLQRLHSELKWSGATGPKNAEDLIKKFNALSCMSSGINEVSSCLAQLLAKGGQPNENMPSRNKDENRYKSESKCDSNDDFEDDEIDHDNDNNNDDKDDDYRPGVSADGLKASEAKRGSRNEKRGKKMKKKYVCNVCGKQVAHASTFNRHKMIHDGVKPHQCQICCKEFRRNHQLKRHYNIHCVAGKFKCNLCDYKVKTISTFLKHMVDKHDKDAATRESCESEHRSGLEKKVDENQELLINESKENLENEVGTGSKCKVSENEDSQGEEGTDNDNDGEEEREEKSAPRVGPVKRNLSKKFPSIKVKKHYSCNECGLELAHYSSYMRHKMIHQNKKPYQCLVCSKSFRRKHQLQRHSMVHSKKGNKYKCELCDYTANTRLLLERHVFEHDSNRLYSCEECGHKTKTTHELMQHKKSHEPRDCKFCEYHADNLSDLRIHERRSHLTLSCSQCDYACFSNWQLQRHLKTHNKDTKELFFCELCGFTCNTKRQFSYHMLRHTNTKPFSCPECDYRCSSRSSLAAHKLMHAGLKPFLCSFCGVSFRRSSHLNNHLLIHKDAKEFVCRTCGHPFRTRHNLKVHEMIHTGEKHHKCHLCPFACRRNKELRLHLEKHSITTMEGSDPNIFLVPKVELMN